MHKQKINKHICFMHKDIAEYKCASQVILKKEKQFFFKESYWIKFDPNKFYNDDNNNNNIGAVWSLVEEIRMRSKL